MRLSLAMVVTLGVGAAIGLGFGMAYYLNPSRTANADDCVSITDAVLSNACDRALNVEICERAAGSSTGQPCFLALPVAAGSTQSLDAVPTGVALRAFACTAPYLPARIQQGGTVRRQCRAPVALRPEPVAPKIGS